MKLYYVVARWHIKGRHKDNKCSGACIANSKEEAIEKFKGMTSNTIPEKAYFTAYEEARGGFIFDYR